MTVVACADSGITVGEVQFNFAEFTAAYPEFATAASGSVAANFALATLRLSNCCGSPIPDANVRQQLLYLLTAHITALFTPSGQNNNVPPGLVGRISSATEGSVSAQADMGTTNPDAAWFQQTKYGAMFWELTSVVRTAHYIPPVDCCGPLGPFDTGYGPGWDNGGWY